MEGRGLTLRSKSRRRPQISAPKPITGPTPPNSKLAGPSLPSAPRERHQQSDATSDLVKRRYSTRFNQPLDLDIKKTPLPSIPQDVGDYGGPRPPTAGKSHPSDSSEPLRVDLKVLRDPSLPAEKCECWPSFHPSSLTLFQDFARSTLTKI
jgi:exocyst complex component 8